MKWEPVAAMALVFLLGLWLVVGPIEMIYHIETRMSADTRRVLIAGSRGVVETAPDARTGEPTFRVLLRDGWESPILSASEFRHVFGDEVYHRCVDGGENWVFKAFNITSWVSMFWVGLGLFGQVAFAGRMLVQWFMSERQGQSIIPPSFWWFGLLGGCALFAYFAWRQDLIGVLGQSTGLVVYGRNIRLISKQRGRDEPDAAEPTAAPAPPERVSPAGSPPR